VLDVRRKRVYEKAATVLPGAQWRDPDRVADWCDTVPKDKPVVVYCIYGHEVGRSTALALRARGINARFLEGGIDAWQRAGQPTATKNTSA
jgi:Fe-Mn family superoxide dismutase